MGRPVITRLMPWLVTGSLLLGWPVSVRLLAQVNTLPFAFRHVGEAQGLSFKVITSLLRDRNGFLWVGTENGLNRFDGNHFTVFRPERRKPWTLGSPLVYALCQDQQGHIWVGTGAGVSRYNPRTGRFKNITVVNGMGLSNCFNILCDRQGRIWFSSRGNGLFCYDLRTNSYRHYSHDPAVSSSLSDNFTSRKGLVEDPRRPGLWIATPSGGLNYLDMTTGQCRNYRNLVGPRSVGPRSGALFARHSTTALTVVGRDKLAWADNTTGQILLYDLPTGRMVRVFTPHSSTGRPAFPMATLFADREQNLWASSWTYTLFWASADSNQMHEFYHDPADPNSVAGSFFWAGWQQDDGTVWLGTSNGLSMTNPSRSFYRIHNLGRTVPGLNADRGINSLVEDSDGSWWVSSATHELTHYYPATGRTVTFRIPSRYPAESGFSRPNLTLSNDGRTIYILLDHSALQFDKTKGQFKPFVAGPVVKRELGEVSTLLVRGDTLWLFGWHRNRAIRYQVSTGRWRAYTIPCVPAEIGRFFVRTAACNRRDDLWLDVYPGGFARFDGPADQFMSVPVRQPAGFENTFFYFKSDSTNQIWLPAAENGLVRYDPLRNTYQQWTHEDGLAANKCMAVCPDRNGRIWGASYNNFFVFDSARRHFRHFTLPLNEAEVNYENYLFPLRNGHILMTLKGYVVELIPERVDAPRPAARVLISDVGPTDTTIMTPTHQPAVRLGVHQNDFGVRYGVLDQAQQPYTYAYKLEGYDDDWVEAGDRTLIVYTNVPGGRYVFRVRASAGNTRVIPAEVTIEVDTAFYNTRWFKLLLGLLVAGLGFGVYRYRLWQAARLHTLQMQATQLQRDKTQIQYQNLINHLNPHFLFNSLTSLNSLIITAPQMASDFLQKLAAIYRYILKSKDQETVTLEHELAFVKNYVDLQLARFEEGLRIEINVPAEHQYCHIVPVTLQNLFENAIKHNIIEDDRPLTIRVYTQGDYLHVVNNLQRKKFVETSNQQGLDSLRTLYRYLSDRPVLTNADEHKFVVKVPLL